MAVVMRPGLCDLLVAREAGLVRCSEREPRAVALQGGGVVSVLDTPSQLSTCPRVSTRYAPVRCGVSR